jgi:hypothetical protein
MTVNLAWTPEAVRIVAEALFGPTWQSRLADAISEQGPVAFPTVRIRHWYLEKNSRPIPAWLQSRLAGIFMTALVLHDEARAVAVRELTIRRGATDWPDTFLP